MNNEWKDWCRLCAKPVVSGVNIFENSGFVWSDRIIKYLSISVNNEDDLPHTVCQSCCQRIKSFDSFAEQCLRVQTMFCAFSQKSDEADGRIDLIRSKYLQEDSIDMIERNKETVLSIESSPFLPSDSGSPTIRIIHNLKSTRKTIPRTKVTVNKVPTHAKHIVSKIKIEDPERRSSRLQVLAQTQIEFGVENGFEVKPETENVESKEELPKKRGRPPKRFAGVVKRKVKKPKVVKAKKIPLSDDDFDELGMEVKPLSEKVSQPSIFQWRCHVCGEMARNWNSLSMHTRKVHDAPAQVLCLCAKVLTSRASIIKHRLKHTDGYKYKCEKCEKSFHRRGCYELHVLSHVPKEEQPFVCCKCARRFHCESLLRQHEKVHLPKEERLIFPCNTCQKKFSSKSAVSAHVKSIHFGERPFVCDQCGHSFTSKGILQEHLTIHSDETPFKCQHCFKSFKTKYRLKIHLDIHRETPYQCPICPLQLSTRRTLRMHLVVHKDTKAFQCSTCGKAFRRAKDLKNHHNLHTGRRPYTCTFCPRTFANGSNCRSHKRRMHPEELRVYEAALAAAEVQANNPAAATTNPPPPPHPPPPPPPPPPLQQQQQQHLQVQPQMQPQTQVQVQQLQLQLQPQPPHLQSMMTPSPITLSQTSQQPDINVSQPDLLPSRTNQQVMASGQDFQRQAMFSECTDTSMKNLLGLHSARPYQAPTDNAVMNSEGHSHDGSMHAGLAPQLRNNQNSARNGHHYTGTMVDNSECNLNRGVMNNSRRIHGNVADNLMPNNIPSMTPLNLNISELHTSRHQMGSNLSEPDRRMENFHTQRTQMGNLNQAPNVAPNLHQLRQHQGFAGNGNGNRPVRGGMVMQHNPEHQNILQGYTSLNHLYQQHSSTVGVPAFPGNPYVHHGMGSSLANYQRGNRNM